MTAETLDGRALAARVRLEVAERARLSAERGARPGLAVILVGDDPASQIYVRHKERAAAEVGVETFDFRLPAGTAESELLGRLGELNADSRVHGILLQLPLPRQLRADVALDAIDPAKDVDGFHAANLGLLAQGRPRFVAATPKGCMRLLAESGVTLGGASAVVVGRSNIVGKPMAMLLTNANATATLCHSRSRDLPSIVAAADIVVAAVGVPEMIRGTWLKEGAVVIDVGMNRRGDGSLCGDVAYDEARLRAAFITPVPGGVGPMTIACLLENTVEAAERSLR